MAKPALNLLCEAEFSRGVRGRKMIKSEVEAVPKLHKLERTFESRESGLRLVSPRHSHCEGWPDYSRNDRRAQEAATTLPSSSFAAEIADI
jgi:hypothetical protein